MTDLNTFATQWGHRADLAQMKLSDFRNQDTTYILEKYLEKWPEMRKTRTGLLFTGCAGSGKTMLATIMCWELSKSEYGFTGSYCASLDTLALFMDPIWLSQEENKELRDSVLYEFPILLIDGFPEVNHPKRTAGEILKFVLRERLAKSRMTWLTSSVAGSELTDLIGKEGISLLFETMIPVDLPSVDFRKVLREQKFKLLEG